MFDGITSRFSRGPKAPKIPLGGTPYAELMPRRAKAKQEIRDLKSNWIKVAVVVAIALALGIAGSVGFKLQAGDKYEDQVKVQSDLSASLSDLAEANNVLSSIDLLTGKQAEALASETAWAKVINQINSSLPSGTTISTFNAVSGGTPVEGSVGLAATVTISSARPIGYSEVLNAISNTEGLKDIQVGDLVRGAEDSYDYTVAFTLDDQVFTKRVTPPAAPPAAVPEGSAVAPEEG